jgi:hypothetical protein
MMAGTLVIWRGEDEIRNESVVVELTDFDQKGGTEIMFSIGKEVAHIRFNLPQLLAEIAAENGSE